MVGHAPRTATVGGDLEALVEQLWQPGLETGRVRVGTDELPPHGPGDAGGWRTVERYRAVPSVARARLLVPDGSRRLAAAAVGGYRALLTPAAHARRTVLTAGAFLGLPLVSRRVVVQVRTGDDAGDPTGEKVPPTPLTLLRELLDEPDLHACVRVNLNTNRKATLQLLDGRGTPRGLAKFAWEPLSSTGVRREAAALRALAGTLRTARVPEVVAEESYYGQPVVVAAPLPAGVRGAAVRRRPPTPVEVHDLFPLTGRAPVGDLAMVRGLVTRIDALADGHPGDASVAAVRALLHEAVGPGPEVPVTARWHGDFVPWNAARDDRGALWVWDWETSEPEAPAGMDALHWAVGTLEEQHGARWDGATLRAALDAASPTFRALGIPRAVWPTVVAVHVAALAERALAHALGAGGWQESWMPRAQLDDLVRTARTLLRTPTEQ